MKMKKKYVIILILALIVMLAAGTYAYFMLLISNDEDSTELYTGTLSVDYSQGDIVYLDSFYPRTEPTLTDLDYAYSNTFSVTNTGTLDGKLSMKLEINENTFTNGAIKYVLYNSNGYNTDNFYFYKKKSAVLAAGDYVAIVGEKGMEVKLEVKESL